MEIPEKLLKFKFHLLAAVSVALAAVAVVFLAPRFVTLLAYFWPLFLSTALFLALVLLFAKTSAVPSAHNAADGILDYVAGHHDPPLDSHSAAKSD